MTQKDTSATRRTFPDDSVRIDGRLYACEALGLRWPPPEELYVVRGTARFDGAIAVVDRPLPGTVTYRRVSCSEISDDDRASMTHVFRGADYEAAT